MKKKIIGIALLFIMLFSIDTNALIYDDFIDESHHKNGKTKEIYDHFCSIDIGYNDCYTDIKKYDTKGRLIYKSEYYADKYNREYDEEKTNYSRYKKIKGKWYAQQIRYRYYVDFTKKEDVLKKRKYFNNKQIKQEKQYILNKKKKRKIKKITNYRSNGKRKNMTTYKLTKKGNAKKYRYYKYNKKGKQISVKKYK